METVNTIPVAEDKLLKLEKEHAFLEEIRAKNREATQALADYNYTKGEALELKKKYDRISAELNQLIAEGPPKVDPQGKLPFFEDAEPESKPAATPQAESPAEVSVAIPSEIAALDLTDRQKQNLAATGAKTLADLADIGNGNWPQYPKGFASIDGFGPKAALKLAEQLPSTAPAVEEKPGHAPSSKVRVELLTMSAASNNLQVGDQYDATKMDDDSIVIQLPGEDPVQFSPGEYRLVEA